MHSLFTFSLALSLAFTAPLQAELLPDLGAFLALRQAKFQADDQALAEYVERGLEANPDDPEIRQEAVLSAIFQGDLAAAAEHARLLQRQVEAKLPDDLALFGDAIVREDFAAAASLLDSQSNLGFIQKPIIQAWALAHSDGATAGIEHLDEAAKANPNLLPVYRYQQAMMLAFFDKEYLEAAEIIANKGEPLYFSDLAYFNEIALRLLGGENARDLISRNFANEDLWPAELRRIVELAENGEVESSLGFYSARNSVVEFLAFVLQQISEGRIDYQIERIFYLYLHALAPESSWQRMQLIRFFARSNEDDDVLRFANQVEDGAAFEKLIARFEIDALYALNRADEVTAILEKISDDDFQNLLFKADNLSRLKHYDEAIALYQKYIDKFGEEGISWFHLYGFGDALVRSGNWEAGKALLYRLVEREKDNADILNYLGYSLVDRGEDLEKGLDMIRRAVELQPDEGFIIDSLGWAYYRAGRFEDAVVELEYAAQKMPTDPTVNSHLGDAYWKAGREREAKYQWKRALLFVNKQSSEVTREELDEKIKSGLSE